MQSSSRFWIFFVLTIALTDVAQEARAEVSRMSGVPASAGIRAVDARLTAGEDTTSPLSGSCRTAAVVTPFNGDAQLPSGPPGMRVLVERRTVLRSCEVPLVVAPWGSPVFLWNPTLGDTPPSPEKRIEFLDLPVVEAAGRCPADGKVYPRSKKTCPESKEPLAAAPGISFEHEYHFIFEAPGHRARQVVYRPEDWWPQKGSNSRLLFAPDFWLGKDWDSILPRLEAARVYSECFKRRWKEVSEETTFKRQRTVQVMIGRVPNSSPLRDERFLACTTRQLERDVSDVFQETWSSAGEAGLETIRAHFGFSSEEWEALNEEVRIHRTTWNSRLEQWLNAPLLDCTEDREVANYISCIAGRSLPGVAEDCGLSTGQSDSLPALDLKRYAWEDSSVHIASPPSRIKREESKGDPLKKDINLSSLKKNQLRPIGASSTDLDAKRKGLAVDKKNGMIAILKNKGRKKTALSKILGKKKNLVAKNVVWGEDGEYVLGQEGSTDLNYDPRGNNVRTAIYSGLSLVGECGESYQEDIEPILSAGTKCCGSLDERPDGEEAVVIRVRWAFRPAGILTDAMEKGSPGESLVRNCLQDIVQNLNVTPPIAGSCRMAMNVELPATAPRAKSPGREQRALGADISPVKIGSLGVSGFCKKSDVLATVHRRALAIDTCYQIALKEDDELAGKLTVKWTINLTGKVQGVQLVGNSIHNETLESCIMKVVDRMRFKKPNGGICIIKLPFMLGENADEQNTH
jgi:hypothetical protein